VGDVRHAISGERGLLITDVDGNRRVRCGLCVWREGYWIVSLALGEVDGAFIASGHVR
jgi:hypothetical protein